MNKAITDGIDLMPPPFSTGLAVWSDQDGTPGSTTYDGSVNASVVPADGDFGTCLELLKTTATQKIRYTGDTPLLPGCYLRVSARVKAMSGNLPSVRVAGWAGDAGGAHVAGLVETGTTKALATYGEVVEVWAIIGTGNRSGVDMAWGATPDFGHFGIDLTGATGGVVRVEDIRIEDATDVFYRKLMDWVDVRDFGAVGDGATDDSAAFAAADLAAAGRRVLVSAGTYHLASSVTFDSEVRFEGTVTMPDAAILAFTRNFDLPTYVAAFGDEEKALKKALQALFNYTDHERLDMCGLRVKLSAPLDVHAAVGNLDTYANRRVLSNGQLENDGGANWDTETFTSIADYDPASKTTLANVANISQIPVGSLVTGTGVGREVYVRSKNVAAGTITLSQPLYAAPQQQSYTFTRFKYMLDFHGFVSLRRFVIADVEFLCGGTSSALLLPEDGLAFQVRDCFFTKPRDRGVTSIGHGCSGLQLDRNQFLSNEQSQDAQTRMTIGFNVNANDAKIRDNRAVRFRHFGVVNGGGHMFEGNHFFQGDSATAGQRTAGLVLTSSNCKSVVNGNYIDNSSIEWTNEHDETPDNTGSFSFGGLSINGNIFTSSGSASWFEFIRVKPHGTGHFINGINVSGNVFKHSGGGTLVRANGVDASIAALDASSYRNITWLGNTYNNVDSRTQNPVTFQMEEVAETASWQQDFAAYLPFGGQARQVVAVMPHNKITNVSGNGVYTLPYGVANLGVNNSEIKLHWSEPVKGQVYVTVRADNPV
ncbi:MAG: glycosyl hydrolase family 28-related protein [Paracoccaceae bacterium]